MRNTIAFRIAAGYALTLLLLVAVAAVAISSQIQAKANFQAALAEQDTDLVAVLEVQSTLRGDAVNSLLRFLLAGREEQRLNWETAMRTTRALMMALRDQGNPADRADWAEVLRTFDQWERAAAAAVAAQQQGDMDQVLALQLDQGVPLLEQLNQQVNDLVSAGRQRAEATGTHAADLASRAGGIVVAVTGVALVAGIGLGVRESRLINRTLGETVGTLASSASELLATATQQAAGAAQQSTSVQDTSATVAEVRQTVDLAARKARTVAEAAQTSVQVAQNGRLAVEESIRIMQELHAHMAAIVERVVTLAEQGRAIAEIIATVDDIAEQSNLLAVNAAIEAAKSGEAGRGFAVVAAEIRSLANQSKQATAQVRGILGEVQRAMQAAVTAAEQGERTSQAGAQGAERSGEAIRALAQSLEEAAQAAQQILASAQQQVVGMDQIVQAMANIQMVSTQTAAGTRQLERAAADLNQLAGRLRTLVSQA